MQRSHVSSLPAVPTSGSVIAFAKDYPDQHRIERHSHGEAQLLYAAAGVMRLTTRQGRWPVPPMRAVWIPAGVDHAVEMEGPVAMRSLYLAQGGPPGMPEACAVLKVGPFLRALIVEAAASGTRLEACPRGRLIASLILLELAQAQTEKLFVPVPADPRLLRVCRRLLEEPGRSWTLERWGEEVGTSPRTLARLFRSELGMGFRAWRDQVRLTESIARLGTGASVERVALELGYGSSSAFIAMFRRNLGRSPKAYLGAE